MTILYGVRAKLVPQEFQDLRAKMAKMDHLENLAQTAFQEPQGKGYASMFTCFTIGTQ